MVAQWFPEIGIVDEYHVLSGSAVGKTISGEFFTRRSPTFIAALPEINLTVDNALAVIEIGLDGPVGIENTTAAAELYAALKSVAVSRDEVGSIFKCACHPPTAGAFFIEPVGGKEQYIRVPQCRDARCLKVFSVHADEAG